MAVVGRRCFLVKAFRAIKVSSTSDRQSSCARSSYYSWNLVEKRLYISANCHIWLSVNWDSANFQAIRSVGIVDEFRRNFASNNGYSIPRIEQGPDSLTATARDTMGSAASIRLEWRFLAPQLRSCNEEAAISDQKFHRSQG